MDDVPMLIGSGRYLPPFSAGSGRRSVRIRNGDEDTTTLAIEAAQDCLSRLDPGTVDELHLAVSRPELTGGPEAEVVREALCLDPGVSTVTTAGDSLAGIAAVRAAADGISAGRVRTVLVIAAEPGDGSRVSAGAVAVLVGRADGPTVRVTGVRSRGDVVYGAWTDGAGIRHDGDARYLEVRVSELARQVMADASPDVVTGVAATGVARACGGAVLPDHGVAGPLLALLTTPPGNGSVVMIAATASRTLAVTATVDDGSPALLPPLPTLDGEAVAPTEVRSSPLLSLPGSSPFFQRASRELLRLEGARCRACGHVVFPPSQRPICSSCRGHDFEPAPLSRTGEVHTFVVNRFLPTGFGAEMALVLADLDDGNRYWAPTSGIRTGDLAIGTAVELRLRRFTDHGGAPSYAMKFVPRRAEVTS